jgi:hypothetical protein
MLTELCAELRNYFVKDIRKGTFEVIGGRVQPLDFIMPGQFFRIKGSLFNDGVHQNPTTSLKDEVFEGEIWSMALPPAFIDLAREIEEFTKSEQAKATGFISESFGGYSYSKATNSNGTPVTWKNVFADRLRIWRKL